MIDLSSSQARTEHRHAAQDPYVHRRSQPRQHAEGMKPSFSRTSSTGGTRPARCPSTSRRPRTSASQDHTRTRKESEPWWHMAKTYAWVMEQEIAEMARKNEETVQHIRRQQERDRKERLFFPGLGGYFERMMGSLHAAEERRRQRRREEHLRRQAAHFPQGMDEAIEEELRRHQARRKQAERCRAAYDTRKALEEERQRERVKQESVKAQRAEFEKSKWRAYEQRWSYIISGSGGSETLTFSTIPWPLLSAARTVHDIRPAEVSMFLLSSHHSLGLTTKDRIRAALRRWHPDRFGRVLARVRAEDRASVEEGVGIVARCLSNLLERAG